MPIPDDILSKYRYSSVMHPGGFIRNGKPALTAIMPELIGEYVILTVKDPLIQEESASDSGIRSFLDNPVLAGRSGLAVTYSGGYHGADVSIVACGSGGPEAEAVLVEFMHYTKAHTFLRAGGAGGIHTRVKPGEIVIASGVVRDEGLTKDYITQAFPAVSSCEVVTALSYAADSLNVNYHIGVARSTDSEHVAVGRPSVDAYFQPCHTQVLDYYHRAGVLYTDRESAAVVCLCALLGRRGGAICIVGNNLLTGEETPEPASQDTVLRVALEGIAALKRMDTQKAAKEKRFWLPEKI